MEKMRRKNLTSASNLAPCCSTAARTTALGPCCWPSHARATGPARQVRGVHCSTLVRL